MKPSASRSLFVATAACLGLASSGCSFVFSRGPDDAPAKMAAASPGNCSGSVVPPIFDTVFAGSYVVNAIWAGAQPDGAFGGSKSSVRGAVVGIDIGLAALHLISAGYGYSSSASCREAKRRESEPDLANEPWKAGVISESETRARETDLIDARGREVFWAAWRAQHEDTACPDALRLLTSEDECAGAACRAPLLLSSGYQKSCPIDTDGKIKLYRMRHRWEAAAGTTISGCLKETFLALIDPAKALTLPEKCVNEGKTEAALRDAARRRPAEATPPAPTPPAPSPAP